MRNLPKQHCGLCRMSIDMIQGRNPLDETIYDESFWMGVDVPNDDDDDIYEADAEDNENDN